MELTDDIRKSTKALLTTPPRRRRRGSDFRMKSPGIWNKPFHSEALGVAPEQIPEARAALRAHGITAEFDGKGRAIVTGPKQYKDIARSIGMFSGRDGYGVPREDGGMGPSGRQVEERKKEFRRKIESGEL